MLIILADRSDLIVLTQPRLLQKELSDQGWHHVPSHCYIFTPNWFAKCIWSNLRKYLLLRRQKASLDRKNLTGLQSWENILSLNQIICNEN